MCSEVTLGFIGFDEFDTYESRPSCAISQTNFSDKIFDPGIINRAYSLKAMTSLKKPTDVDLRIKKAAWNKNAEIMPMMSKVSGEISVDWEWGGEDGGKASASISGSASDNNGNTAEVTVEINDDGSGKASASVSHDSE